MELFKGHLLAENCDDVMMMIAMVVIGGDMDNDDHDHDDYGDHGDHGGDDDDDRHYAFVCSESQFSKDTFQSLKRKILFFPTWRLDSCKLAITK